MLSDRKNTNVMTRDANKKANSGKGILQPVKGEEKPHTVMPIQAKYEIFRKRYRVS
jgi:hypothetical protein